MFAWLGQRYSDILGLNEFLRFSTILCCDYGIDGKQFEKESGYTIISIEKETGIREKWSNFTVENILSKTHKSSILKSLKKVNYLLPYSSSHPAFTFVKGNFNKIKYLGIHPKLKEQLDNKFIFRKMLIDLGVNVAPGEIIDTPSGNYQNLSKRWGKKLVIQFPIGSSGSSTFFVNNKDSWKDIFSKNPYPHALVMRYLQGPSLNINAVVTPKKVFCSYPSVQVLGIPELSNRKFVYCGNDFSFTQKLSTNILSQIYHFTTIIGREIYKMGYLGIFGIDFILDGESICVTELNPRFQGSTQLLTNLEIHNLQKPLVSQHLYAFTGEDFFSEFEEITNIHPEPLSGSQIILNNKINKPALVEGELKSGIYTYNGKIWSFSRAGKTVKDCKNPNEILITCAIPNQNLLVLPEAPLLRIHSNSSMLETTETLTQPIKDLITHSLKQLKIQDKSQTGHLLN